MTEDFVAAANIARATYSLDARRVDKGLKLNLKDDNMFVFRNSKKT
jgi:hypothetical protein